MLDIRVRYIILFFLILLNFLSYFNSPLLHSNAIECFGIKCRDYTLLSNLMSFTFLSSMIVSMSILNNSIFIPFYWFIPLIILGYTVIFINWKHSKIVKPRKGRITPPPLEFTTKNRRLAIVSLILVLHLFLFILNFIAHRIPTNSEKLIDIVFKTAFGGLKDNRSACMTGWLSVLGIVTSSINIYFTDKFRPTVLGLPNSWGI